MSDHSGQHLEDRFFHNTAHIMSGSKLQRNGLVTNMARSNAVEYAADFIMSHAMFILEID